MQRDIKEIAPPRFHTPGRRPPRSRNAKIVREPLPPGASTGRVFYGLGDEAAAPALPPAPPPEAPEPGATGGVLFTDVAYKNGEKMHPQPPTYDKLRYAFSNADLWDTLTPQMVDMMLNPPKTYDPAYQRRVNVAVLTSIKTLQNIQRMESTYEFERLERLEKRVGDLERGPKRW